MVHRRGSADYARCDRPLPRVPYGAGLTQRPYCYKSQGGLALANTEGGQEMLYWAAVFLVIAIVAGLLGFGVVAFAAAGIAKICFFIFLVLFIISLIGHSTRRSI